MRFLPLILATGLSLSAIAQDTTEQNVEATEEATTTTTDTNTEPTPEQLQSLRKEVEQVQRDLFARRRQLMTENEEIRRLRTEIATLERQVNKILTTDEAYAELDARRQVLRDRLSDYYLKRAAKIRNEAAKTAATPAPE